MPPTPHWTTVSESPFPWEREALDYIRERMPASETWRAWSNFEFIADDGSINEVDLLLFSPMGFFLIEIKSNPGRLTGDAGSWNWVHDGRTKTVDNPLFATDLKSKKLRSLLEKQNAFRRGRARMPYVQPLVFCSAEGLQCDLQGAARTKVCLRDREATDERPARPGIMAAVKDRDCPGLDPRPPRQPHDRPTARAVAQALDQAGIRQREASRRVGDYRLRKLVGEGPGYQDWEACHSQVENVLRRARLYLVRTEAAQDERDLRRRAAEREFQLISSLRHPGVLEAHQLTQHTLGPALLMEHDPQSIRFDHYLLQRGGSLSTDARLDLVRQIAEVVRYAHDRRVVHRALSPQSILLTNADGPKPEVKVFNWQLGYRAPRSTSGGHPAVSATSHVERFVEEASTAYLAPETLTEAGMGEHLDVFSLGALAFHIFSGQPPASSAVTLAEKLRGTNGLQISSVLNGASPWLQDLVQTATHPVVATRTGSASEFLEALDLVEEELTEPEDESIDDPTAARIDDTLAGGYRVKRRLGKGACSIALLVEFQGADFVMKVANHPDQSDRLAEEAEVLQGDAMRHQGIVDLVDVVQIGQHFGFLMRPIVADRDNLRVETLGQRLRSEGSLQIDLLQRFGEDLLSVVLHLEENGVPHRDIKPDNIAVGRVGGRGALHAVLFDFSLSRTPAENVRAGTPGYLDPLLPLRQPPRWDLHAERYSAAATLYELATGALPKWGDGVTEPSQLPEETEATLDLELLDGALRRPLGEFFGRAFRRDITQRFDNAEVMLRAWRAAFEHVGEATPLTDQAEDQELQERLAAATFDSAIHELGLGTRATNALDRANILTVADLLTTPARQLVPLRGVGSKTRKEITAAVRLLRERLGTPEVEPEELVDTDQRETASTEVDSMSVDLVMDRVVRAGQRKGDTFRQVSRLLLGLEGPWQGGWPSQSDITPAAEVTRGRVGQIVTELQKRWSDEPSLTSLRQTLHELLEAQGGVASPRELADALLVTRGSMQDEPLRGQLAQAAVRACVEVERSRENPRYIARRREQNVLIATDRRLIDYAWRLGKLADSIAAEDPLLSSSLAQERLQEVPAPEGVAFANARLLRLAATASSRAAVSSRQELYPRGMDAGRAVKLSQGALFAQRELPVEQIVARVRGRYPLCAELPGRPALDSLLEEAGLTLNWDPRAASGHGAYRPQVTDRHSVSSLSTSLQRWATSSGTVHFDEITPEVAEARQFEERLNVSLRDNAFQVLLVPPKRFDAARDELLHRFDLELVDCEGVVLDALRAAADEKGVDWNLVLRTDATPSEGDWDRLLQLVEYAKPAIQERLLAVRKPMLMVFPGLLARYDQMDVLDLLAQRVGRDNAPPAMWLLLTGDSQAMIEGKPVPLTGHGQKASIPESWLANRHRTSGRNPPLASENEPTT
ncbi:MAG: BREX system serine/threonine kinase PglW [Planctomycetota bacterium]